MSSSTRRLAQSPSALSLLTRDHLEDPDESQRALMATLGITFQDGIYRLGAFRFDRLANAISYARLRVRSPGPV